MSCGAVRDSPCDGVADLLVLSRAVDRELPGRSVDLPEAARRAVERWRAAADAREIVLSPAVNGTGTAWCARADLDRALDVLIENALRYSPAGG
jgi:signal transduction histidine kinase